MPAGCVRAAYPRTRVRDAVDIPWARLGAVRVGIVLWGGLLVLDIGRIAAAPCVRRAGCGGDPGDGAPRSEPHDDRPLRGGRRLALVDGFVEHRDGMLGFHPAHDLAVLTLLTGLALAATHARR